MKIKPLGRSQTYVFSIVSLALLPFSACAFADASGSPQITHLLLPSARPVGNPIIDTIHLQWWVSSSNNLLIDGKRPAVVFVPGLGDTDNSPEDQRAAAYFTHRGVDVALMTLPYAGHRVLDGKRAQDYYLSQDPSVVAQAMLQSASDVSTVMDWVKAHPDVDPDRTGIMGFSLGAIVVHLAMGLDPQLKYGVAVGGGGNLEDIDTKGMILFPKDLAHHTPDTPEQLQILRQGDPLTYAANNQPRHVLMIEGARDTIIPPRDATQLWNALGRPPIQWPDFGHLGVGLAIYQELAAGYGYLTNEWAPPNAPDPPVPQVTYPVIKLGFLTLNDSATQLALQYEAAEFGHRSDHTALVSLNVGETTSRPFAAIGLTATHFVDIGIAMRLGDGGVEPYFSTYFPL